MTNHPTYEPPQGGCPLWCTVNHSEPLRNPDGTPITLPDGRPLLRDAHESAPYWTGHGMHAALYQGPGRPVQVALSAPLCTVLLPERVARDLAEVLAAGGVAEVADVIRRALAGLDGGEGR